jgi:hypothetical protein
LVPSPVNKENEGKNEESVGNHKNSFAVPKKEPSPNANKIQEISPLSVTNVDRLQNEGEIAELINKITKSNFFILTHNRFPRNR